MAIKIPSNLEAEWSDGQHQNIGMYTTEGGVYDPNAECFQDEINSVLSDLWEKKNGKLQLKTGITQAKNGVVKGDSSVFLFKNITPNSSSSNIVAPTFVTLEDITADGTWVRNDSNLPEPDYEHGEYTYMTYSSLSGSTNRFSNWSHPIRITGANGEKGADGTDIEFIYTLYTPTDENSVPPYVPGRGAKGANESYIGNGGDSEDAIKDSNKTGIRYNLTSKDYIGYRNNSQWLFDGNTGSLPCVWHDNPQGVSNDNQYEWVSVRYSVNDSTGKATWSAFQTPSLWSKWGETGKDGDGVEYIFTKTKNKPEGSESIRTIIPYIPQTTEERFQESEYTGYTLSEYNSKYGTYPNDAIWTDDPVGADKDYPYEWVSMRKKKDNTWKGFSEPSLWSIYAFDGGKTVFIYKKSQAKLTAAPIGSSDKDIPEGWTTEEVELTDTERENGYNIYMSYTEYSEKTEKYGTWSTPIRLTGQDGEKGADGTDIEFIYARTEENIVPTYVPLAGESYTDTVGNTISFTDDDYVGYPNKATWESKVNAEDRAGKTWIKWYDNPQGVTETLKYEWVAVRYSTVGSDGKTKAWIDEFQGPSLWAKWGEKGQDGDGYEYIYTTTVSGAPTPETPDASYAWTPTEADAAEYNGKNTTDITKDDFIPRGWTDDPVGVNETNHQIEYVSVRKKIDNVWQSFSSPKVWARYAKDGDTGNTYKYAYTVTDGKTPDKPANKAAAQAPWYENDNDLVITNTVNIVWLSTCLYNPNNGTYGNWSEPIRITGEKGERGADGDSIEFIYLGGNTEDYVNTHPISQDSWTPTEVEASGSYANKNTTNPTKNDFIPRYWLDNAPALDGVNIKYVWIANRTKSNNTWSSFSDPTLWSRWGEDGKDGDGVEYIYKLTTKLLSNSEIESSGYKSTVSDNGKTIDQDDFVPSGWTDNPSGVTSDYPYEYVSIRKSTRDSNGKSVWTNSSFSKPVLWATWTANGTTVTFIYKNAKNVPKIGSEWNNASTLPTGWLTTMTNPKVDEFTYMSQSYTRKNGDVKIYEAWSSPARISGANGKPGTDGADIEFVYARTKTLTISGGEIERPETPTTDPDNSNLDDNFFPIGDFSTEPDDNFWGWFDSPKGVDGVWKYEWISQRTKKLSDGNTQSGWSSYSPPVIWSSFGEKGQDGDGVEYIFKTTPTITAPEKPGTTSEWIWSSDDENINSSRPGESDFVPKGWSDDPLDVSNENQFQWVSTRRKRNISNAFTFDDFTEPKLWSRWGAAGDGVVMAYYPQTILKPNSDEVVIDPIDAPTLTTVPASTGTRDNDGRVWYPHVPTVEYNKNTQYLIIWSSQANRTWSDEKGQFVIGEWSTPARISALDGRNGADGTDIEFIYFRTDAIDNITWGNVGSTYVHPKYITVNDAGSSYENEADGYTPHLRVDDFVPRGWTDNPSGVENSAGKRYEWVSQRTSKMQNDAKTWGDFSEPSLWSRWSKDGTDGPGLEYVFFIDTDGDETTAPGTPSSTAWTPTGSAEISKYNGKNTTEPTKDDFIPRGWTDDPSLSDSRDGTIEWVSIRKKTVNSNGKAVWDGFSKPSVWARSSKDGVKGNTTVFIYRKFKKKDENQLVISTSGSAIPTDWSVIMPKLESGESSTLAIYMSSAEKNGETGVYGTWSTPTRITGDNGERGEDGSSIEYIYALYPTKPHIPQKVAANGSNKPYSDSDFIPKASTLDPDCVWTDHPSGVSKDNLCEWVCIRKSTNDVYKYSDWYDPSLWAKYGENGLDGDGVQYVYRRNNDEANAPELGEINSDTGVPFGWTDDPKGVNENLPFEWVSVRRKTNETWGSYSDPTIWSRYTVTYQVETIFLNKPIDDPAPTIDASNNGKTTIPGGGWSNNATTPQSGYYTYMSQSNKNTSTGTYVQWSTPIRITGENGTNGNDGSSVEFIYKLYKPTTSKPEPTKPGTVASADSPTSDITKDRFVPEGWTDHPSGIDSKNTHEWMCTRTKINDTWGGFGDPVLWSRWGEDGTDGDGLYYWFLLPNAGVTAPTVDTTSLGSNGIPVDYKEYHWTDNPTGVNVNNPIEYVMMVRESNTGSTTTYEIKSVSVWREFVKDGNSVVTAYANGIGDQAPNVAPYIPNNKIPGGWSKTLSTEAGKVTWMIQSTLDSSTNLYSTWQGPYRLTGNDGKKGADGTDIEFIYLITKSDNKQKVIEYIETLNNYREVNSKYYNEDDFPTANGKNHSKYNITIPSDLDNQEWTDHPTGVSEDYICEWVSQRVKDKDSNTWKDFTPPALWAKYGKDGISGDGVEYRFKRIPSSELGTDITVPTNETEFNTWNENPNPNGVSEAYPIEYCCIRKTIDEVDSYSVNIWKEYTPYTRYAESSTILSTKIVQLNNILFTNSGDKVTINNTTYYTKSDNSNNIINKVSSSDGIVKGSLFYIDAKVNNLTEGSVLYFDIFNESVSGSVRNSDSLIIRALSDNSTEVTGNVITSNGSYKFLVEYIGGSSSITSNVNLEVKLLSTSVSTSSSKSAELTITYLQLKNIGVSTASSDFIGISSKLVKVATDKTLVNWTTFDWTKTSGKDGISSILITSDVETFTVTAEGIVDEANSAVTGYNIPISDTKPAIFNCKLLDGNTDVTDFAKWSITEKHRQIKSADISGKGTVKVTECFLDTTGTDTDLKLNITIRATYNDVAYVKVLYIGITKVDYTSIFNVTNKQFESQFTALKTSYDGQIDKLSSDIKQTANGIDLITSKNSAGIGDNLIKDSSYEDFSKNWTGKASINNGVATLNNSISQVVSSLETNSWYTLSFDFTGSIKSSIPAINLTTNDNYFIENSLVLGLISDISKDGSNNKVTSTDISWTEKADSIIKRASFSFLTKSDLNEGTNRKFTFTAISAGSTISKIKLEKGKYSTPWIKDTLTIAEIESKISQTEGMIESSVRKNISESIGSGANILANTKFESEHDKWGINTDSSTEYGNYITFGNLDSDNPDFYVAKFTTNTKTNKDYYLFQNGEDNNIRGNFEKNSWYTLSWWEKSSKTRGIRAIISGIVEEYYTSVNNTVRSISANTIDESLDGFGNLTITNNIDQGLQGTWIKRYIVFKTRNNFSSTNPLGLRRLVQFNLPLDINNVPIEVITVSIANIKLEKGKNATEWCETGVSTYTLESKITQTEQNISLKVIDNSTSNNKNILLNTSWDGINIKDNVVQGIENWNINQSNFGDFRDIGLEKVTEEASGAYNSKPTLKITVGNKSDQNGSDSFYELVQGLTGKLTDDSKYTLSFWYNTETSGNIELLSTGIYQVLEKAVDKYAYISSAYILKPDSDNLYSKYNLPNAYIPAPGHLFVKWPNTGSKWYKAIITFTANQNPNENKIFFLRVTDVVNNGFTTSYLPLVKISHLKLEAGSESTSWFTTPSESDLLATGIDINNRNIVVTADKFKIRSNDGLVDFFSVDGDNIVLNSDRIKLSGDITANGNVKIDKDGCITAKNANIQGTVDTRTGGKGEGILIDPDNQNVVVYDENNNEVTKISGQKETSTTSIYGTNIGTTEDRINESLDAVTWVTDVRLNNKISYLKLLISTSVGFTLTESSEVNITCPNVGINIDLDFIKENFHKVSSTVLTGDANIYTGSGVYIANVSHSYYEYSRLSESISDIIPLSSKTLKLSAGSYTVKLVIGFQGYVLSNHADSNPKESIKSRLNVFTNGNKLKVSIIPNSFTSRLFSNGISLGTNYKDNLTIINPIDGGKGTELNYVNGDTNFKLCNSGIYGSYLEPSSGVSIENNFFRLPQILLNGKMEFKSSYSGSDFATGKSVTKRNVYIFKYRSYRVINGYSDIDPFYSDYDNYLVRKGTGLVSLNLRELLVKLYGSSAVDKRFGDSISLITDIFITITPSDLNKVRGGYVSLLNFDKTSIDDGWVNFSIADDESLNDGDFYIKVELL